MTVVEWSRRVDRCGSAVVIVAKHKTGDKEPATLVVDGQTAKLMER